MKIVKSDTVMKLDSNVAISRTITSMGRVKLMKSAFIVIENNPGRYLMYVDTDRIFFGSPIKIKDTKIADDEVFTVQKVYKEAYFAGAKLYCLQNMQGEYQVVGRGVNSSAKDNMEVVNQFKNIRRLTRIIIPDNKKFITKRKIDGRRVKRVLTLKIENNIVRAMKRKRVFEREMKSVLTTPYHTKDLYVNKGEKKNNLGWTFRDTVLKERPIFENVEDKFASIASNK